MKPNLHKPDEKLMYHKVLDQVFLCSNDHRPRFSGFMNVPFAQRFLTSLREEWRDFNFEIHGGIEGTERVKIGISPDYLTLEPEDYPITALEIKHNKFKEVRHKDILGSVLGLGVDRGKIGDVLMYEKHSVIFLDEDMEDFVRTHLEYIGSGKVTVKAVTDLNSLFMPLGQYQRMQMSLDEPRLSEVVARGFKCARGEVSKLMTGKKVFINWEIQTKDKMLVEGDIITVRGYGRIVLEELDLAHRKGGIALTLNVYGN